MVLENVRGHAYIHSLWLPMRYGIRSKKPCLLLSRTIALLTQITAILTTACVAIIEDKTILYDEDAKSDEGWNQSEVVENTTILTKDVYPSMS